MKNVEQTILSQYANSRTIITLIHKMNAAIKPNADIDNFYNTVWNVDTAVGFGLDIWGRIVGISRTVLSNPVYSLDDDAFRSLILLKALSNITASTSQGINQLLQNWVGSQGQTWVSDLGGMYIRYNFNFQLTPVQIAIIQNSGIFLRPSGVGAYILQADYPVFGFNEMGTTWASPFGQAPFVEVINAD